MMEIRLGPSWRQTCVKANWDHKLERVRDKSLGDGNILTKIACSALPWVPLVRVEKPGVEVLSVNGREVRRVTLHRGRWVPTSPSQDRNPTPLVAKDQLRPTARPDGGGDAGA